MVSPPICPPDTSARSIAVQRPALPRPSANIGLVPEMAYIPAEWISGGSEVKSIAQPLIGEPGSLSAGGVGEGKRDNTNVGTAILRAEILLVTLVAESTAKNPAVPRAHVNPGLDSDSDAHQRTCVRRTGLLQVY